MRVFKNAWFSRFADREALDDDGLKTAAFALENGRFDVNLGGGVYKLRVPRPGGGKSRGYRVIVLFKCDEKAFFVYGVRQSEQGKHYRRGTKKI